MTMEWLTAQLSLEAPGFWLALSILALPLIYIFGRRAPMRVRPWLAAARWVFIPYAGLLAGGLSPRFLGLSKINWATTLSLGVAMLSGVLLVAGLIRLATRTTDSPPPSGAEDARGVHGAPWSALTLTILWIGAEQFHWSFVRGALWELLYTLPQSSDIVPAYRAMWLATLITLPEIWLQPSDFSRCLLKSALLIVTAVAFFYTRNFWLCWIIHAGAWLLIDGVMPVSRLTQHDQHLNAPASPPS
jgi:hypothetical protein